MTITATLQIYTPPPKKSFLQGMTNYVGLTFRATSHTRLRAHDHDTLIGGKAGAGPSLLHTMLEGPTEYVNAR